MMPRAVGRSVRAEQRFEKIGAGEGIRTLVFSLEGFGFSGNCVGKSIPDDCPCAAGVPYHF
jgi:hypothetical protein